MRPSRALLGPALEHSAATLGIDLQYAWVPAEEYNESIIESSDAIFVAPGAPDEEIRAILKAIQSARLNSIPCLGTCGGFQRIVSEYALNELGFEILEHEEISPDAHNPFFSHLNCSLVGEEAEVLLIPDSKAARIYDSQRTLENFFCQYGINKLYLDRLQSADLKVSAFDSTGEARIVELPNHPFFMATLFVPQVRSTSMHPHPLITAFLKATIQ